MRYVVFMLNAGEAGTDEVQFDSYDNITDQELDNESWERAVDHASMYGIYPMNEMPDDYNEDEDSGSWGCDQYSDNIDGYWEEYDPENKMKKNCLG